LFARTFSKRQAASASKTLAEGGGDTAENSAALCPNCHRSMHLAKDREQRRARLYAKVSRLEKR